MGVIEAPFVDGKDFKAEVAVAGARPERVAVGLAMGLLAGDFFTRAPAADLDFRKMEGPG